MVAHLCLSTLEAEATESEHKGQPQLRQKNLSQKNTKQTTGSQM